MPSIGACCSSLTERVSYMAPSYWQHSLWRKLYHLNCARMDNAVRPLCVKVIPEVASVNDYLFIGSGRSFMFILIFKAAMRIKITGGSQQHQSSICKTCFGRIIYGLHQRWQHQFGSILALEQCCSSTDRPGSSHRRCAEKSIPMALTISKASCFPGQSGHFGS